MVISPVPWSYGSLDATDLHFTCDGSEVAGQWDLSGGHLARDGLAYSGDTWVDDVSCWPCEGVLEQWVIRFLPDGPLPPEALCELVLDAPCRTEWGDTDCVEYERH